jgi:hypothetical protein
MMLAFSFESQFASPQIQGHWRLPRAILHQFNGLVSIEM